MIWIKGGLLGIAGIFTLCIAVFVLKCYCTARTLVAEKPVLQFFEERKKQPSYCKISDISTNLKMVIVALEDKNFFRHKGFDSCKIIQAFYVNLKCGEKRLGGSTITQQLAKNMYFSFKKTYSRKVAELFVAGWIEKALSKEEILELYLNIIFYGKGQYNISDACQFYFGKMPSEITCNQAITIGSLIPAPTNYNPLSEKNLFSRAKKLALQRLCRRGLLKEEDIEIFMHADYKEMFINKTTTEYENIFKKTYEDMKVKQTKVEK